MVREEEEGFRRKEEEDGFRRKGRGEGLGGSRGSGGQWQDGASELSRHDDSCWGALAALGQSGSKFLEASGGIVGEVGVLNRHDDSCWGALSALGRRGVIVSGFGVWRRTQGRKEQEAGGGGAMQEPERYMLGHV